MNATEFTFTVDGDELDAMHAMVRAGGYVSMEHLVKSALWRHADHLEVEILIELFGIRRPEPPQEPDESQPMLWEEG